MKPLPEKIIKQGEMKMRKLTKEQFINQFPYKANVQNIQDVLAKDNLYSNLYEGVEVYRALNELLIKIDGQFYSHG
jgi:hypothetical protein